MTRRWHERIAPREFSLIKTTACRIFPFGLGRQLLAGPGGVGFGIAIGNLHDRMVVETSDRTAFAIGTPPVGAEPETPPVRVVAEIDRLVGRTKDERSRLQHVRQRARI